VDQKVTLREPASGNNTANRNAPILIEDDKMGMAYGTGVRKCKQGFGKNIRRNEATRKTWT
jgi:hypothetical protein